MRVCACVSITKTEIEKDGNHYILKEFTTEEKKRKMERWFVILFFKKRKYEQE